MYLWLDDLRDPTQHSPRFPWVWVKTARECKNKLATGQVTHLSLDHDLGGEKNPFGADKNDQTGYTVACWIEEQAANGTLPRLVWAVHSQNPVGADRIRSAMSNADSHWSRRS